MKYLIITIGILFTSLSFSQDKSKAILNKLSAEMKAMKSFSLEFSMNTKNSATGLDENGTGKGFVKGDKFNVTIGSNNILSNGVKTWTITSDDKTVYTSDANEDDEESINPKKIMTIWEKGFKSKYAKEENGLHVINLYPTNPGEVEYHTITVFINKNDGSLKKAFIKMKDGTTMNYVIKNFKANVQISDTKFVFNKAKYPGYEIVED